MDWLDPRPAIVSPSWVEESRKAKKRLVERAFVISRPKEALLLAKPGGRTPGSGPGAGAAGRAQAAVQCSDPALSRMISPRCPWLAQPSPHFLITVLITPLPLCGAGRKRKQAAPPPKPQSAFDMGELFTSSQQIRGEGRGAGNIAADEVTSPRAGGGGGGGRGAGGAARKRAAAGGSGGRAAKAARPSGGAAERSSPCGLGTDTQAVSGGAPYLDDRCVAAANCSATALGWAVLLPASRD